MLCGIPSCPGFGYIEGPHDRGLGIFFFGGKLNWSVLCVMPVMCVCVCVSEWQLTRPHSWSLWGASLLGLRCRDSPVPGSAVPCLLAHCCHIGRALQGEAGCEVEGIRAAAVRHHHLHQASSPGRHLGIWRWLARFWCHLQLVTSGRRIEVVTSQRRLKFPRRKANTGGSTRSAGKTEERQGPPQRRWRDWGARGGLAGGRRGSWKPR